MEQASTKNDLQMANFTLEKLTEQISVLEEKLQNAFNENAQKLRVKQKEDEKLWIGLESKFSATKTLCDQLTETLQQLNVKVQQAEKDKAFFEDKLSATSVALDKLQEHMKSMSLSEKELIELGLEKGKVETSFRDEQNRVTRLIEEKDGMIKHGEDVAANREALESLTLTIVDLQPEMTVREDNLLELTVSKEKFVRKIKSLEDFVSMLVEKFTEMEHQSLTFFEKVIQLNGLFDSSCLKLAQQEKDLVSKSAQKKFDQIDNQCTFVISGKNELQLVNHDLKNKVLELQKDLELAMVEHAEECRIAEEKIRKLESEARILASKQTEMQAYIDKLEDDLRISSETSRLSDEIMVKPSFFFAMQRDLLRKQSELTESKGLLDGLKADTLKKQEEIDLLQKEVEKSEQNVRSLEKKVSELENALEDKDRSVAELKAREKEFDEHKAEESLANAESKLQEAKKQYDLMLESKLLELSKHLKEISQRYDQAINDIRRRKYEVEKQESVNLEKEKVIKSMSLKLDSSEETIKSREKEITELGLEEDKLETSFTDEQNRVTRLTEEKDGMIKQLRVSKEKLEKENNDLLCRKGLLDSEQDAAGSLEKKVSELENALEEKDRIVAELKAMEKESQAIAERKHQEAMKIFDRKMHCDDCGLIHSISTDCLEKMEELEKEPQFEFIEVDVAESSSSSSSDSDDGEPQGARIWVVLNRVLLLLVVLVLMMVPILNLLELFDLF